MEEVDVQRYTLFMHDAIKALSSMKSRQMHKSWTCLFGKSSIVVIESDYDDVTWKIIWNDLKKHFDNDKLKNTNKITDSQKKYKELMKDYIERNCKVIAELPKISGKLGQLKGVISFLLISHPSKIIDLRIIQYVKVTCRKCVLKWLS